jgi:hypothetical protein
MKVQFPSHKLLSAARGTYEMGLQLSMGEELFEACTTLCAIDQGSHWVELPMRSVHMSALSSKVATGVLAMHASKGRRRSSGNELLFRCWRAPEGMVDKESLNTKVRINANKSA